MTSTIHYLGDLRHTATHLQSGSTLITDAPVDNNGKGEAFSPTDLLATSLGLCMMTIIGIRCRQHSLAEPQMRAEVTKIMAANPRRVSEVRIQLHIEGPYTPEDQAMIEREGRACPVALSLHPDLKQEITFHFNGV